MSFSFSVDAVVLRVPDLPLQIPLLDRLALVVELFALRDRDLDFGIAMAQEHFGGHAGDASAFQGLAKLKNLFLIEQKLAVAEMVDVIDGAFFVGGDMHVGDVGFAIAYEHISVRNAGVMGA